MNNISNNTQQFRIGPDIITDIILGIIAGLIIDKAFEYIFGTHGRIIRIILQFVVILIVFYILDRLYIQFDRNIMNSVFFVSIFLGVQQSLFSSIHMRI